MFSQRQIDEMGKHEAIHELGGCPCPCFFIATEMMKRLTEDFNLLTEEAEKARRAFEGVEWPEAVE